MSKEGTVAPAQKCRPRFKGIENFLRRVAYNLGNSPSQTEVKIISCIPIDVSDMQKKIISLERELETKRMCPTSMPMEARMLIMKPRRPTGAAPAPAAPAQSTWGAPHAFNTPSCCHEQAHPANSFKSKKSCVSFMYPSLTSQPSCKIPEHECANKVTSYPCADECDVEDCERSRGLLRSLKRIASSNKKKEKDRCKTHYVYYAETMNSASPFTNYNKPVNYASRNLQQKDPLDRSYLATMVRKQYRAEKFVKELSDTSQFSSPICRDASQSCSASGPYDSDACSCCHGQFHNIDHTTRQLHDVFTVAPVARNECVNSMYYDSSLYDLVPVREKPPKAKIDEEILKQKEFKGQEYKLSRLEQSRIRSRHQPYVVNRHNAVRVNRNSGFKRKLATKSPNRIAPKRRYFEQKEDLESSNTCTVDCGGIYLKPNRNIHRPPKAREPVKTVLLKNAECLTISVNTTECQTASTKSVQLETPSSFEENKTEITLNQIKSILQSVLTEVKTNSQVKSITEDTLKKDAVVQKGPSQSNIQTCSSLLNSFTYSPYSMSPYLPSCSRQVNNLCYPNTPFSQGKCLQNYPLFIQTGRQCTCCFRNIPNTTKYAHAKQTTTVAATNTEVAASQHRNKETEKLIKEIYKSIAVNMDYPAKDTSTSEYDDLKSSKTNSQKVFEFKFIPSKDKRKDVSLSDTNRNKDGKDNGKCGSTPVPNASFGSNVVSNTASTRSRLATKTTAEQLRNQRITSYLVKRDQMSSESERRVIEARERETRDREAREREARQREARARMPYMVELPNASTPTYSDDTETLDSDEAESDDTVLTVQKTQPTKKKSGLFSKVAKLFKSKSKKQEKIEVSEKGDEHSESGASDSDDYQTICTHPSRKRSKHVTYTRDRPRYKARPHSKVSYSRYYMQHKERPQERGRRTPYMEQEYRRHWNENLAFHGRRSPRYSSERPFSRESVAQSRRQPIYYRNYEARPALVGRQPREAISETAQVLKQRDYQVDDETVVVKSARAIEWLRRYKQGLCGCGREWKRFLLDS